MRHPGSMIARTGMVAMVTLALAACSMAPRYEQPPVPVPASYPHSDAVPLSDGDVLAADIGWREVLRDPRLQALVALALENNRDLRLAALNVEAARAQYRIQRAEQLPNLALSAEGTRQRLPAGVSDGGVAPTGGGIVEQYSAGLGMAAFELDLFGRVRSLRDAALAEFLSTREARRGVQISLVAAVASAYLSERTAQERLVLVEQSLQDWEETGRLARLRFDAGVGSELDLVESRTLLETARGDLAAARRQAAQARNLLAQLVGTALPVDLPEPRPLQQQAIIAELPAGLPSDLISRRPDILAAEQRLRGADANIGAARAAFFPRLSLTGFLGSASPEFSSLFESGTRTWLFSPQLTLPIFDAGRNRGNLDLAWVRRDVAVAEYEATIQQAFREVADALDGREALAEQLRAQQSLVEAARRREALVELRFRSGVDSNLALLDARRSRYASEQALLRLQEEQLTNLVDLYRALGGGWHEATPAAAPATAPSGGDEDDAE